MGIKQPQQKPKAAEKAVGGLAKWDTARGVGPTLAATRLGLEAWKRPNARVSIRKIMSARRANFLCIVSLLVLRTNFLLLTLSPPAAVLTISSPTYIFLDRARDGASPMRVSSAGSLPKDPTESHGCLDESFIQG